MCERTCPCCGSKDHIGLYGLAGYVLYCNRCGVALARRRDIDAAPMSLTDDEAEAWVLAGSFVLEGAEAACPKDDEYFGPNRSPVEFLAF